MLRSPLPPRARREPVPARMVVGTDEQTEILRRRGVTVLVLRGDLDITRTPRLQVVLNEVLRSQPAGLVIDLCGVSFVDSTGLALLLNAQRRASRQGIPMRLACNAPRTLELLNFTRLVREFDLYPTRREAVRSAAAVA